MTDFERELQNIETLKRTAGKEDVRKAKHELLMQAMKWMFAFSTDLFLFYKEDAAKASSYLVRNIVNSDTAKEVYRRLIKEKSVDSYEEYVLDMRRKAEIFYDRYFSRFIIEKDGVPYSEIRDMYWDENGKCWWSRDEKGRYLVSDFMPYHGTPLKLKPV